MTQSGSKDLILQSMEKHGLPKTLDVWMEVNWGKKPSFITGEMAEQIPEEFETELDELMRRQTPHSP